MNKEFLKKLKALAKKYGFDVLDECIYCQQHQHSDESEDHWMITFFKEREDE